MHTRLCPPLPHSWRRRDIDAQPDGRPVFIPIFEPHDSSRRLRRRRRQRADHGCVARILAGARYSVRYGLTETPSVVSHKAAALAERRDPRAAGSIVPCYDVQIVDASGRSVERGRDGSYLGAAPAGLPYRRPRIPGTERGAVRDRPQVGVPQEPRLSRQPRTNRITADDDGRDSGRPGTAARRPAACRAGGGRRRRPPAAAWSSTTSPSGCRPTASRTGRIAESAGGGGDSVTVGTVGGGSSL